MRNIFQTLRIYSYLIFVLTIFRIILFVLNTDRVEGVDNSVIIQAFIMGLRFDTIIACYILSIFYIVIEANYLLKIDNKKVQSVLFWYLYITFTIVFAIATIDVPYFIQFFLRGSIETFDWFINNTAYVLGIIFIEPKYSTFVFGWIGMLYINFKILKFLMSYKFDVNIRWYKISKSRYALFVVMVLLIVLGSRGRFPVYGTTSFGDGKPLQMADAFFTDNSFLNQMGLNPVFTTIRTALDKYNNKNNDKVNFYTDQEAISNIREYLKITPVANHKNPVLRNIVPDTVATVKKNVVLVLMESMTTDYINHNLTPYLDSLTRHSIYFKNTYSAGIHTYNGVFSTLFGVSNVFRNHTMNNITATKYDGIASELKKHNYSTGYFITHNGNFDNMKVFLQSHSFDYFIDDQDFPKEMVQPLTGVPDDYFFEHSIPRINEMSEEGNPFFVTLLSGSNHSPYKVPDFFKAKNQNLELAVVEYSDYSLKKFMELASKQKWYDNTIFVFVGDHGKPISSEYNLSLTYNQVPLIFYSPELSKNPKTYTNVVSQIDVYPSIMHLLKLPYQNGSLGIDLFSETQPYVVFNADNKYGVIDNEWLLVVHNKAELNIPDGLYKYKNRDPKNYAADYPEILLAMKKYAESSLQVTQYLKNNDVVE